MTAPLGIYPLSTGDGRSVPLDVVSPTGLLTLNFSTSATSAIALPNTADIIAVSSTADCYVRFANSSAVIPVSGTIEADLFFVDSRIQTILYPQKKYVSVIGLHTSGILRLQFLHAWKAIALVSQFLRR